MRPHQHRPRTLTEAAPIPTGVVGQLAASAIDRYEQLTRNGRSAGDALWPPVDDPAAAAELETTAATRDWTVPAARVQQLAADAIGLYVEGVDYDYDYDRHQARGAAVAERLEGETARTEVPPPERHAEALAEPASPDVAGFAMWVERAERLTDIATETWKDIDAGGPRPRTEAVRAAVAHFGRHYRAARLLHPAEPHREGGGPDVA
jgi:hypothetical protein